jgi:two-component system nitrogen regulation sensor histidine kinase NtrY
MDALNHPMRRNRPRWWRRAVVAARRANLFQVIEIVSVIAFLVMTSVTWLALQSQGASGELVPSNITAILLIGTLVPAMAILVLLGRRIALRRTANYLGGTGGLHVRLVFIFSIIAAVPTLLVVVFASLLFQSGVEFWFSDSSRGMLENANKLARGYYEQAQRDVGYESVAMAEDIGNFLGQQPITSPSFAEFYSYQVVNRKLTESAILQAGPDGRLRTAAIVDPEGTSSSERIGQDVLKRLEGGREALVVSANANRIEAVIPIDREAGIYLYAARSSDLLAFSQGQRAENIVEAYQVLTSRARLLQLRFNIALFVLSLGLVGLSVWFALRFADSQVKPVYQLVDAARGVGAGNFALRIEGRSGADEIGLLNRAFNRMTAQIEKQTRDLVSANQQLQERRAFIEAVLESVSAGVVSLDETGKVLLMNSTAQALLLDREAPGPIGVALEGVAPQIAAMAEAGTQSGIVQYGKAGELVTLAVKISRDRTGHVITFEDITRQLVDQRQAAWSDVARRIAHEIKNPLTPIQLATERLSRRYRKQIEDKPELFEELTSTIIRQVGELRKMVDEFSSFARLPKPVFRGEDIVALTRQALFLQEVSRPDIGFSFSADEGVETIACDRHQFGQAMTNVLKNAVEAIDARASEQGEGFKGAIAVALRSFDDRVEVSIADNGIGLPIDRDRIVEPYVTTRDKGTGLGLAIVNKIVEEHSGEMSFSGNADGGATVSISFARDPMAGRQEAKAAE